MDLDTLAELDELMQYWTKHISRQWSQACFTFEHGGRTLGIGVGSCIAHAHLQILPLASDPMSNASGFLELPTLVDAFLCAANSEYLLCGYKGSWQVAKDQRERGQFFRRVIASSLGKTEEWDYLSFPNLGAMQETLDRLP